MKKILIAALFATPAFMLSAADGYIVNGDIPGILDGTEIQLLRNKDGNKTPLSKSFAQNGKFMLTGNLESPAICELRIVVDSTKYQIAMIDLMMENGITDISVTHIDSIPHAFYVGNSGLVQFHDNVSIVGGRAQREYQEYKDYMYPYECETKELHRKLYWDDSGDKSPESKKVISKAFNKASLEQKKAVERFAMEHPSYSISGMLLMDKINLPYSRTLAELDVIERNAEIMWDKTCLAELKNVIEKCRKYPKGKIFTDFEAYDVDLTDTKLSNEHDGKKYLLVDFWASWCGPCRAAIPHVRELYKKYTDKLNITAVSLDSDEAAWRKAMEKEKMEWTQLWVNKERVNGVKEPYEIKSIPFMLLIDPEGNIVFSGQDPNALSEHLSLLFD